MAQRRSSGISGISNSPWPDSIAGVMKGGSPREGQDVDLRLTEYPADLLFSLSVPGWSLRAPSPAGAGARSFSTGGSSSDRLLAPDPRHPKTDDARRSRKLLSEVSIGVWAHDFEGPSKFSDRLSLLSLPFVSVGLTAHRLHPRNALLRAATLVASAVILSSVCAFR
jgi:hypothetical protein